jgi:hypothetical protein
MRLEPSFGSDPRDF